MASQRETRCPSPERDTRCIDRDPLGDEGRQDAQPLAARPRQNVSEVPCQHSLPHTEPSFRPGSIMVSLLSSASEPSRLIGASRPKPASLCASTSKAAKPPWPAAPRRAWRCATMPTHRNAGPASDSPEHFGALHVRLCRLAIDLDQRPARLLMPRTAFCDGTAGQVVSWIGRGCRGLRGGRLAQVGARWIQARQGVLRGRRR
jgi:hypothetical protein